MPDEIQSFKLVCSGGLNSNENHLFLAEATPGAATRLVNFEPSLYGGYRRIEGYSLLGGLDVEVGAGVAEGPILGLAIYKNEHLGNPYIIAARKDLGSNTYSLYQFLDLVGWQQILLPPNVTLAYTANSRTVTKIRHVQFDFGSGSQICLVDGVNNATVFDGTNWYQLNNTNTGGTSSPGGDQIVNAPSIVEVFENHLFLGGDLGSRAVICHSAPSDPLNFMNASGGGQITPGFNVVQFKPFRDDLFVFGVNAIKKVSPDVDAGFTLDQVTTNVGCVARDSVLEIGGDLIFLSPEGFRPVAGTSRIGDVELGTLSKSIQVTLVNMIKKYDMDTINGVVIRGKSQVRFFVGDGTEELEEAYGIIGGLSDQNGQIGWEFGELVGIRTSCVTSDYIGLEEYVLHGDHDGKVYRQEEGTSFNERDILGVYATPYLDFGDTEVRKTLRKVNTFIRSEGPVELFLSMAYDWGTPNTPRPVNYVNESEGGPVAYGAEDIDYAGTNVIYGGNSKPIMTSDIQGSGFSARATFTTIGQSKPYSIQGLVFEFSISGRR
jgi:hypothetical protein